VTQFAWHIHHMVLVEPMTEPIENRIAFIRTNKPKHEVATRLRLLKPVQGVLPVAVVEARKAYVEARKAYDEEIDALHAIECPNCPWDGHTIFPKEKP